MTKKDYTSFAIEGFDTFAEYYQERFSDLGEFEKFVEYFAKELYDSATVLELGCGPGNILSYLASINSSFKLSGIDLSPNMISLAGKILPEAELNVQDIREFKYQKKYDGILLSFCLPYLNKQDTTNLLNKACDNLEENGLIYISTMEGDYEDSKWTHASSDPNYKSLTHYYSFNFISKILINNGIRIIQTGNVEIPNNTSSATSDLILIGKKDHS